MKIARATVLEYRRALDGRSWNPTMRWRERRAPLLLLRAEDGTTGIGEAWSRQAEIDSVLAHLARVAARLVGKNAMDNPADPPWVAPAAASAVDIALWDLRAKQAQVPAWRWLAGDTKRDGSVAVYASGGLYRDGATTADLTRELASCIEHGFRSVKMKIGALPLQDDLARVRAVRAAIGRDATLWVDAVEQLTDATAPEWCSALRELGVAAIQAPVPVRDIQTMARINRTLPVIAAEGEHDPAYFAALLQANAVTYLQFCLGLCGGASGGARLDTLARTHGAATTPQCFSTAVLQAASLHFGAAHGNVGAVEFHRFHDHLAALMPAQMRTVVAGRVNVGDAPGLGLAHLAAGRQVDGGEIVIHGDFP
jgi:L-alanine-DL-glutamate epimerase-like enolase superfamily enzyme